MAAIFCGHCGAPAPAGAPFCGRCGAALAAPGPAGAEAAPATGPGPTAASVAVPCPRCGALNAPGARFCGRCALALTQVADAGAVTAAPMPGLGAAPMVGAVAVAPMYPVATGGQLTAALPHKTAARSPWLIAGGATLVAAIVMTAIAFALKPNPPGPCGSSPCPQPPSAPPLPPQKSYTSTTYGYSFEYGTNVPPPQTTDSSASWQGTLNDGSPVAWTFSGEAANGRGADQLVAALHQQSQFPDATRLYDIPQAEMGYQPGFGTVYDVVSSPAGGQRQHLRQIIIAAVKNGIAVELVGVGAFIPDQEGHPNPAQTPVMEFFDNSVNTVTWKGDPPI